MNVDVDARKSRDAPGPLHSVGFLPQGGLGDVDTERPRVARGARLNTPVEPGSSSDFRSTFASGPITKAWQREPACLRARALRHYPVRCELSRIVPPGRKPRARRMQASTMGTRVALLACDPPQLREPAHSFAGGEDHENACDDDEYDVGATAISKTFVQVWIGARRHGADSTTNRRCVPRKAFS